MVPRSSPYSMKFSVLFVVVIAVLLYPSSTLGQRRVIQAGGQRTGGNQAGTSANNEETRLGLLAGQLGVAPVPGGGIPTNNGQFGPVARDESCWCQPVNQVCTALRPENLDLVTRIVNKPGSPSPLTPGSNGGGPSCTSDKRVCCPSGGFPGQGGGFPGQGGGFPGQGGGFPGQGGGFPGQGGGFPGQGGGFPGQGGGHNSNLVGPQGGCGTRRSFGISHAISPTADFGEYPWMAVVLGPGDAYISGGVMIADNWILTAPHKLSSHNGLKVRLGDYDVGTVVDAPQFSHYEVPVSRVIIHPEFNSHTLANDVALLQLQHPINRAQYPHVTPACLPSQGQKFDGRRCFATGWGKNAFGPGNYQRLLQEVDVPVINGFRCENQFKRTRLGQGFKLDQTSFICAGGELDKDACEGDGGSPLVCGNGAHGWTVVGLVAWGVGCAQKDVPGAYVNVASYANFIKQYVH